MLEHSQINWGSFVEGVAVLSFFITFFHTLLFSLTVADDPRYKIDPSYKIELIDRVKAYLLMFNLLFVLYSVVIAGSFFAISALAGLL